MLWNQASSTHIAHIGVVVYLLPPVNAAKADRDLGLLPRVATWSQSGMIMA